MTKLSRRIGGTLLALAMLLTLLPATALAAPAGPYVAGTELTGADYWKNDGSGGITADGASENDYNVYYDGSGTLTLKGASISNFHSFSVSSSSSSAVIYADGDLNLVLEADNDIDGAAANGIYTTGGLTISGSGSMVIAISDEDGCGIFSRGLCP